MQESSAACLAISSQSLFLGDLTPTTRTELKKAASQILGRAQCGQGSVQHRSAQCGWEIFVFPPGTNAFIEFSNVKISLDINKHNTITAAKTLKMSNSLVALR